MPNLLPIEGDWQHLIEKRSGKDRRTTQAEANAQKKAAAALNHRRKDRRKSGSQGK